MRKHVPRYLDEPQRPEHVGLLLDRFLVFRKEGRETKPEKSPLVEYAALSRPCPGLYELAYQRPPGGLIECVETPKHTRLIVGLGQKGVVEAGLRLHHAYGTPLLPGSALKGLAAHYAHERGGEKYRRDEGEIHRWLFGTTEENGCIRFDDAWAKPGHYELHRDVMTPHHSEWQEGGKAPTDFDSPIPVPFVSVSGTFRLALSWQGPPCPESDEWVKRTMKLLMLALEEWGIGGKTSSGYGRLVKPEEEKRAAIPAASTKALTPPKRGSGTPVKVNILGTRPKGGFTVQEEGRNQGSLTQGKAPDGVDASEGKIVDVLIHVDDPRNPQYKWPDPLTKGGKSKK